MIALAGPLLLLLTATAAAHGGGAVDSALVSTSARLADSVQMETGLARCRSARFFIGTDTSLAELMWLRPDPYPDQTRPIDVFQPQLETGDFTLCCDSLFFSAEQRHGVFRLRGKSLEEILPRILAVQLASVDPNCRSLSSRSSWLCHVTAKVTPAEVDFKVGNKVWFEELVVAVKINDGPLQQVVFEGNTRPIPISPGDRLDFYVKEGSGLPRITIRRFSIDTQEAEMAFWRDASFPDR
jgi:hypothetical protein